ncbi:SnoaL-like polyketide cyclase [compost metagenome]
MSSTAQNIAITRRLSAAVGNQDFEAIRQLISPDYVHARPGLADTLPMLLTKGPQLEDPVQRFCAAIEAVHLNFEEWRVVVDEEIASDDIVVSRQRIVGRYRYRVDGSSIDRPTFEFPMVVMFKIKDSRVAQVWALGDELAFLKALGVSVPALTKAALA